MSRVLVTGGTGAIGAAVVHQLLADPAYDVRVADRKAAPQWMREGCEIRSGDLRCADEAASAMSGCPYVIHLASTAGWVEGADYSVIAASAALDSALLGAAIAQRVKRFVYVSCASELERPGEPPAGGLSTGEAHPPDCAKPPRSARGFAQLVGERLCRAAHAEHGLASAVCRLETSPPARFDELAAEIVATMSATD